MTSEPAWPTPEEVARNIVRDWQLEESAVYDDAPRYTLMAQARLWHRIAGALTAQAQRDAEEVARLSVAYAERGGLLHQIRHALADGGLMGLDLVPLVQRAIEERAQYSRNLHEARKSLRLALDALEAAGITKPIDPLPDANIEGGIYFLAQERDALREEVARLRALSEHDTQLLTLANSQRNAAEQRVRALEAALRDVNDDLGVLGLHGMEPSTCACCALHERIRAALGPACPPKRS